MRFLFDAQLPPGLGRWLSEWLHTCDHVNDVDLGAATDDRIEAWARALRAIVWSADPAFAERARNAPGLQVVWLRCGNTTNAALRARLAPHLNEIEAALAEGEVLVEVR